jgi:hypothetical protein
MRAASAQWQRRARGAHMMPFHRPLQLRVMRQHEIASIHLFSGLG